MSEVADQPVVVVTGGGAGIGDAVAEELGRTGWFVVTVDPLVTLDGSEQLPPAEETTAGRIIAAGGSARASSVSVTDREGIAELFSGLVDERGRLDAVINAAGISRPTSFTTGSEEDWLAVLSVHLDGYLNVLDAALPIMAAAGRGRILGVTSGSGWRQANAGAYGCAKRAVAALTWQLGAQAPEGVAINAMSPIAVTRMVTAALGRAGAAAPAASSSGSAATGGLSLGSMPTPEELAPMAAHLVSEDFGAWCSGQLIFVGGSEVAVIEPPKLLEVVQTDDVPWLPHLLERFTTGALIPAETTQTSGGGSNPRFGPFPSGAPTEALPPSAIQTCAIVSDRPDLAKAIEAALATRGVATLTMSPEEIGATNGFEGAAAALRALSEQTPSIDAVVVALADAPETATDRKPGWEQTLTDHTDLVKQLHTDIAWVRAVADHAAEADRPIRLLTLTDASATAGGTRAQVSAQLARAAQKATKGKVAAFAVSLRSSGPNDHGPIGHIAAHLLCSPAALGLSGAELATRDGWFGLEHHPHPATSITFDGREVPSWLNDALCRRGFR